MKSLLSSRVARQTFMVNAMHTVQYMHLYIHAYIVLLRLIAFVVSMSARERARDVKRKPN